MSIANIEKRLVSPTHPGGMLREDFMPDYKLTTKNLAEALGGSRQTVNELLRKKRAVSPGMALRLSRFFENSPQFWFNAQQAYDLWNAEKSILAELVQIKPLNAA